MEPKNEIGVIVLFAQQAERYGFEIIEIQPSFPDALVKKGDTIYRVEFEYQASSFHAHQHDVHDCDLVICWRNDLRDMVLPILSLSSVDWPQTPLILPSNEMRDAYYWKCRALKAEREIKSLRRVQAIQTEVSINTISTGQRAVRKHEAKEALLAYVAQYPLAHYVEIAEAIGRSKSTVCDYVGQLTREGRLTEGTLGWQVNSRNLSQPQQRIQSLLNESYSSEDVTA